VISFGASFIVDVRLVSNGIENGHWPQQRRCSDSLIESGILDSRWTPAKVKA
jgi:hypothetical protein